MHFPGLRRESEVRLRRTAKQHPLLAKLTCREQGAVDMAASDAFSKYYAELLQDTYFSGLFLVIKSNAPAPVWEVKRNGQGQIIEIRHRKSWPYVRHFYFHFIDREWGHITIRICSYPPFGAQLILNGHERVERRARRKRVAVVKDGNCFIEGSDFSAISRLGTEFNRSDIVARLRQLADGGYTRPAYALHCRTKIATAAAFNISTPYSNWN
jgi:hypothetical protein